MARNDLFESALSAEGITGQLADLARSIYKQESGSGSNTKTSNAGAHGGMQIVPGTFNQVADKGWDINDPLHNARAGIRYVGQMYKQAGGDPALAAAGYYGGPGGLEKARRGIAVSDPRNPNAPNTLQYGQQVASRLGGTKPVNSPVVTPVNMEPVQPVQLAQVPQQVAPEQIAQYVPPEQVQVAPPMQVDPSWGDFQQAMPRQVQMADLDYGKYMPPMQGNVAPNFTPFSRFKGRV